MMVDNLGKNMMLDTWDNKIFMPRFYDCDTICSYDNSGQLKFDVDIEMAQGYWNTSSSRLWTRIRDLMHDDLVAKYNDMRQNGLSYESLMQCFYDEQIAKIPQKYYNMDYDIKYAPFADSYLGMANGDTYEHLKRWLKNRLIFVDTLYDYAPSYNNDMLTIRANTTEPMTIYIETYTPVYQHLSWYNGQMDKKKIDGKVAVEFTGTAMAATDQEVLIYGGTNIKKITGISSMNPNRMLIGSATRLIELDAHDCPLLSDINANKSNLAPHVYLNKVNLSGCPLLGGNLIINNSPLVREIDIRGTGIVGLNLPSNLRNLEVLKLPSAIKTLNLNDAGQLHTLEFDSGSEMETVSMTNCNVLTNVVNFDLENVPNVTLNNSYNIANELYFSKTTNLSLRNMSNLERVIYLPNAEYETFDKTNVNNASDYKVSVFNSPKCNTFMVTAPYRESYMLNAEVKTITTKTPRTILDCVKGNGTQYINTDYYMQPNTKIVADLQMTVTSVYDYWMGTDKFKVQFGESDGSGMSNYNASMTPFTNFTSRQVWTFTTGVDGVSTLPLHIFCGYSNGNLETSHIGIGSIYSFQIYEDTELVRDYEPCKDTDGVTCLFDKVSKTFVYATSPLIAGNVVEVVETEYADILIRDHGEVKPDEVFIANSIDISDTRFTDVKLLATTDTNMLKLPSTTKNIIVDSAYDLDTEYLTDGDYDTIHTDLYEPYNTDYENTVTGLQNVTMTLLTVDGNLGKNIIDNEHLNTSGQLASHASWIRTDYIPCYPNTPLSVKSGDVTNGVRVGFYAEDKSLIEYNNTLNGSNSITSPSNTVYTIVSIRKDLSPAKPSELSLVMPSTPNIIPSASDGSLIFAMYAPSMTDEPDSGVWDMSGLELNTMHTFGLNNDVKPSYGGVNKTKVYYGSDLEWIADGVFGVTDIIVPGEATTITADKTITNIQFYTVDDTRISNRTSVTPNTTIEIPSGTHRLKIAPYLTDSSSITMTLTYIEYDVTGITMPNRYDDYVYELDNLHPQNEVLRYTASVENVFPTMNAEFQYDSIVTPKDGLYEHIITAKDLNNLPTAFYFNNATVRDYFITVDYINTSNVTDMSNMFYGCSALTSLNISSFDTSKVTAMNAMFYKCINLTSLDLSNFDTSKVTDMASMFDNCNALTSLDVSNFDTKNVTNMAAMFQNCNVLTSLDLSSFDTTKVENMSNMFDGCSKLTSLDVSNFNTSNVTTMGYMFQNCYALTSLDLSNFDTSKVTNMSNMFNGCKALTSLDVSNFDTSNVTIMSHMFYNCNALTSLDLSDFDTSNVTSMGNMFYNCSTLTSLDLSNFDTTNVTHMAGMFAECKALTSLDLSNFNISNVTAMNAMFNGCNAIMTLNVTGWPLTDVTQTAISSLPVGDDATNEIIATVYFSVPSGWTIVNPLDILIYTTSATGAIPTFNTEFTGYTVNETDNGDGTYTVRITTDSLDNLPYDINFSDATVRNYFITVDYINTSNCNTMMSMFYFCTNLKSVNFNGCNTSKVTNMNGMFNGCSNLTSLDLSDFDTSNVTSMGNMFYNCSTLTSLDVSSFNTSKVTGMNGMFQNCKALTSLDVSGFNTTNVTNMNAMFANCSKLTSLDVSNFNTTKVKDMIAMFQDCSTLTSLDVSNFNTTNVTSMSYMFHNCKNLTSLDVSSFDTSSVTTMNSMFQNCNALTSLDLSDFDTSNVTSMKNMFNGCYALTSLDVSGWDTRNVTDMGDIFSGCSELTSLDLSNFDTSKVTLINGMFYNCKKLLSLDLSNFNTSKVTNMNGVFQNCNNLTSLDLSNFNTSNVTRMAGIFQNCSKLTSLDLSNFDTSKVTLMDGMFSGCNALMSLNVVGWPNNTYTQAAISSLPTGDDATNEIYATVAFTVPSGWSLINSASMIMSLRQTDLDNLTDEEIAALVDEGWTIG